MDEAKAELENAIRRVKIADHMLNMTYDVVSDSRVLLSVLDNLYHGTIGGVTALLKAEAANKKIPAFGQDFDSKINTFKLHCVDRLKISRNFLVFIMELQGLRRAHEESPVEIKKHDRFIMFSSDYKVKALTKPQMKDYLFKAKVFIQEITNIMSKNKYNV